MLAGFADRLEEADKLTDSGMPFTSAFLLQAQDDPQIQLSTCSFFICCYFLSFSRKHSFHWFVLITCIKFYDFSSFFLWNTVNPQSSSVM